MGGSRTDQDCPCATSPLLLSLACSAGAPTTAPQTAASGQPKQSFVKDLIRLGSYTKASTDQSLDVTSEKLQHWADTANAMNTAGVKIPVNLDHEMSADATRGYARDFFVSGGTLFATIDLIGQDAIDMAGRTEVSIGLTPKIVDGKGNEYENAIEHVALTSFPVVPGQGGFIKLSRGQTPVYRLSTKEPSMDAVTQIAQAMGISTDGADPATLLNQILARCKAGADMAKQNDTMKCELDRVKGELENTKVQLSKSTATPPKPDSLTLSMAAENRSLKINHLLESGRICKAQADLLTGAYIGGPDRVALSRTVDEHGLAQFDLVMSVLSASQPPRSHGTVTGVQNLSRGASANANEPNSDPILDTDLERERAERRKQQLELSRK